ncbi:hypothetical protein TSAR_011850 [Trichomalopsis sarcophagae]|uniref:Ionotropic glutamate receptor L-glutamate and glycine-binding domain-containing protein n=1 Tax=Trichomalopsis sarcophagae TaxID=543379 RepID=A0A232FHT9_9HYME|nr:hypothetical protein TSAR_011850 [Trichomalopsis sarcophagae]
MAYDIIFFCYIRNSMDYRYTLIEKYCFDQNIRILDDYLWLKKYEILHRIVLRFTLPFQYFTTIAMWWCKLCLLILLVMYKTSGNRHFLPNYVYEIDSLINIQMHQEGYQNDYPIVHVFAHKEVHLEWFNLILSTYSKKVPIVLFEPNQQVTKFSSSNRIKFHYVVAIFKSPSDVNVARWKIKIGNMWNVHSKFIIWITGEITQQQINHKTDISQGINISNYFKKRHSLTLAVGLIENLFKDYWSAGAANVILVVFNNTRQGFDTINYNPFVPMANQQRGQVCVVENNEPLFPDKFINLYGYPITVSMFHKPPYVQLTDNHTGIIAGEDVEFINSLRKRMNFTLVLKSDASTAANYGIILPNGESVGLIGDLLLNRSDMLGNSRYLDTILNRKLDFLYPYDSGTYYAVVPRRPTGLNHQVIGQHWFSGNTVMCLLPFPILTLYLYLRNERNPILVSWNLVLYQRFLRIGPQNHDRIIRFTWIVFALLITCGFESRLIKILTSPSESNEISILEDLVESNLTLMVGDKMFEPINDSTVLLMKKLAKKTKTNLNFSICSERLLNRGDVACASDKLSALLTLTTFSSVKSNYQALLMKEELGNFWKTYVVKYDLPYLTRFDILLRRLIESGIKVRASKNSTNLIETLLRKKETNSSPDTIKIRHLSYAFGMCFAGLCMSLLVFLREIYTERQTRKDSHEARTRNNLFPYASFKSATYLLFNKLQVINDSADIGFSEFCAASQRNVLTKPQSSATNVITPRLYLAGLRHKLLHRA